MHYYIKCHLYFVIFTRVRIFTKMERHPGSNCFQLCNRHMIDRMLGAYSQHFILCITYEWVQRARAFVLYHHFQPTVM
jgi:hypothetical protein